jgi:2'-5' RNA ligase
LDSIRCFLALPLTTSAQQRLKIVQRRLSDAGVKVKWEPAEKLHLTVRFLGDTRPERRARLEGMLGRWSEQIESFDLAIHSLGAFPSTLHPRVIWAGAFPSTSVLEIGAGSERLCGEAGWPAEKHAFHPHITLARVRVRDDAGALTKALSSITFDPILVRASELMLMRSDLLPGGSQYRPLTTFPFHCYRSTP